MEETYVPQPMGFGQYFTSTLKLIQRTLTTAALPAFAILVAMSIIQGFGTMLYFEGAVEALPLLTKGASQEDQVAAGMMMVKALMPLLLTSVVAVLGLIFVQVMTSIAGWQAFNNEPIDLGELMDRTVGRPLWFGIIQTILLALIMSVILLFLAIILFSAGIVQSEASTFIFLLVSLYPFIATLFRIHKVTIEDRGPWQGLISSIALVNSNFGRVFGAVALFGVIFGLVAYGIGLATGTGGMAMSAGGDDPAANLKAMETMLENYTWGAIITSGVASSALMVFGCYLLTPLYADSRIRRGDFMPQDEYDIM